MGALMVRQRLQRNQVSLKRTIARQIAGDFRDIATYGIAHAGIFERTAFRAIAVGAIAMIVLAGAPLSIPYQRFVGFPAGVKSCPDKAVAAEESLFPHNFFDCFGTGDAAVQKGISAAEALVRRNEFLIEVDQQDDDEFHLFNLSLSPWQWARVSTKPNGNRSDIQLFRLTYHEIIANLAHHLLVRLSQTPAAHPEGLL